MFLAVGENLIDDCRFPISLVLLPVHDVTMASKVEIFCDAFPSGNTKLELTRCSIPAVARASSVSRQSRSALAMRWDPYGF
jgi:hypothetical protein